MTDKEERGRHAEPPSLFSQLVIMFATSTLQQLGKLVNPMTGKTEEPDLEGAQATIDMLDMLEQKTRGNLDEPEAKLLRDAAASLKMTYVDTARAPADRPAPPPAGPAEGEAGPGPETPKPGEPESKGPRYHKKYG